MNRKLEHWHSDSKKQKAPIDMKRKRFLHVKTRRIYVVTGVVWNATTDEWMIVYKHESEDEISFVRTIENFNTEGRFLEINNA